MDCSGSNMINLITLEYLSNTKQYDRYMKTHTTEIQKQLALDKKFYRKRITQLTKNLLQDKDEEVSNSLRKAFNCYLEECINYFKTTDTVDLLQDEYKDLSTFETVSDNTNTTVSDFDLDTINSCILKQEPKSNKIEDCLNIKKIKGVKNDKMIIPKKRNINIKNPQLKRKGLKKKSKNKSNEEKKI